MRQTAWIVVGALFSLAACTGVTLPSGVGAAGDGAGGAGGGRGGHVTVGNDFFQSARNASQNPAVDTIAAGSTVTWARGADGSHSIQSTGGAPEIFRNSIVLVGVGYTYAVIFKNPGTYTDDCAIHGAAMTGRIVVQ